MKPSLDRRLLGLVAVHLPLTLAPALAAVVPSSVRYLPLLWVLASFNLAQLMLLGFWGGMGTNRLPVRLVGVLAGIAGVASGPLLHEYLATTPRGIAQAPWADRLLAVFAGYGVLVLLIASVFFLVRRWFWELVRLEAPAPSPPRRFQFSILHLLIIASVFSLVLGLTRSARLEGSPLQSDWSLIAVGVLSLVMFAVNTVCAARAVLSPGAVGYPITLVLLVALLLGVDVSVASRQETLSWWLTAGFALASVVTTGIVLVSLLVVRRCGYRLVSKKA